jgi:hypothetical protein
MAVKTPHLVAYDYGQGAVWAVVFAESTVQIQEQFPELSVVPERPAWMTDDEFQKIEASSTYDISDRVVGLLAEIIDARPEG